MYRPYFFSHIDFEPFDLYTIVHYGGFKANMAEVNHKYTEWYGARDKYKDILVNSYNVIQGQIIKCQKHAKKC